MDEVYAYAYTPTVIGFMLIILLWGANSTGEFELKYVFDLNNVQITSANIQKIILKQNIFDKIVKKNIK